MDWRSGGFKMKAIYFPLFLIVLKEIENNKPMNGLQLSVKCNVSYSYINNLQKSLSDNKLIEIIKLDGRSNNLVLTEKGKRVVFAFNQILEELSNNDLKESRRE